MLTNTLAGCADLDKRRAELDTHRDFLVLAGEHHGEPMISAKLSRRRKRQTNRIALCAC